MKKQLLKTFYAFITILMLSISAKAQIVYTDVNPDSTFACNGNLNCNQTYFLDLNNDGLTDFRINLGYYYHNSNVRWVSIIDSIGNAIAISPNGAKKFLMNDAIGPAQTWQDESLSYLRRWSSHVNGSYIGEWIYETDKYLGLALNTSGLTYYGWVRLDVTVDASADACICIIKDYAYNSIPNQPILAGQTMTTGIIENTLASSMNLFPNPASDVLTTDFTLEEPADVQFGLYDIVGNYIVLASEENYAAGPHRKSINVEQVPPGIYQLAIKTNKSVISHKVIVQH